MDSRYRFLTLGTPCTQSMPSRDVNAVARLAEASWRRDNEFNYVRAIRLTSLISISLRSESTYCKLGLDIL